MRKVLSLVFLMIVITVVGCGKEEQSREIAVDEPFAPAVGELAILNQMEESYFNANEIQLEVIEEAMDERAILLETDEPLAEELAEPTVQLPTAQEETV